MKFKFTLFLICTTASKLFAQPAIEKSFNMYRSGDGLIKQQVEYIDPGEAGKGLLWDFSRQKLIEDNYELTYFSENNDSTIIGQEHSTLYKYSLSNDSLFCLGYENPTTLLNYSRPELILTFPFHYQNRSSDYFCGSGEYSHRLSLEVIGSSTTFADAYGTLILPSGDTLKNTLRIYSDKHMVKRLTPQNFETKHTSYSMSTDSISYYLTAGEPVFLLETYRWFADGYRYPVFETVHSSVLRSGKPSKVFNTAFYYTPQEQYYGLPNDPDNTNKRERIDEEERRKKDNKQQAKNNKKNNTDSDPASSDETITYNLKMKDNVISLDYELTIDAVLEVRIFDMQGRLLQEHPSEKQQAGKYFISIPVEKHLRNEYLLQIMVNDQIISEKIANYLN